ncbi:MAG: efflux RND transporter periplasmic adaptor subunit [Muribaculaceae bacterium]
MTNKTSEKTIIAALAMCMAVASCSTGNAPLPGETQADFITVDTVSRTVWQTYSASLKGRQDVDIYPQVSGTIVKMCINEGAKVNKGEVLFVIDQVPYKAAVETASADVKSAEAAVENAQITADSKSDLCKQGVVSDIDLRTSLNNLNQKKALLMQAKASLVTAQNNLNYTEVKSPVSGNAGMIAHRVGALIGPSMSKPLVTVSDNSEMYAYFSMTEKQMLAHTAGGNSQSPFAPELELQLADGSIYSHSGHIDAVSGLIDASTGAVSVRAVFANPDGTLRSGGQALVRVPVSRKGCIVVPQEATFEIQDKVMVYRVIDGKTKATEIGVLPINDGKEYVVESGLTKGDVIVANGVGLMREGIAIKEKQTKK